MTPLPPSLYRTYSIAFINVPVKQFVGTFKFWGSTKNDLIKYILFYWALHKSGDWTPFLKI